MADVDTKLVKSFVKILQDAELTELTIEQGSFFLSLKKENNANMGSPIIDAPAVAAPATLPPTAGATSAPAAPAPAAASANTVKSPMVGTAYLSPEPGAGVFVRVGDKVSKGQTLLLVEAMKTFNAVDSPRDGVVKSILVEDSQPVEFDEPLMVIE